MTITIDIDHDLPRYSPVCTFCKHAQGFRSCAAFGEKPIPRPIWVGENDHTKPYPDYNGIRFERAEGLPDAISKAERLERTYRAGELSAEQEERYLELRAKLRELAPDVERIMELRGPPEVLE
jgi:hypothetical protein